MKIGYWIIILLGIIIGVIFGYLFLTVELGDALSFAIFGDDGGIGLVLFTFLPLIIIALIPSIIVIYLDENKSISSRIFKGVIFLLCICIGYLISVLPFLRYSG